jgi:hypothetical protein
MRGKTILATTFQTVRTWLERKFLLGDAQALAAHLPPADREQLIRQLDDSAQKRESGEILAASDQPALALELAERAVDVLLEAVRSLALEEVTRARSGDDDVDLERLRKAGEAARVPRPAHNRDVTPADKHRTALALAAAKRAERRLLPLVQPARRIAVRRAGRIAGVAAIAIALVVWPIRSLLRPGARAVTASISYDQTIHAPGMAVDGDPDTEWLLPNATLGSIEIKLRPRRLHAVHLRNAHNGPYDDRAARDFHIEGLAAGKLVHKATGSFSRLESQPTAIRIPFETPAAVDTLKIVIDSYHRSGGGLAEISWD